MINIIRAGLSRVFGKPASETEKRYVVHEVDWDVQKDIWGNWNRTPVAWAIYDRHTRGYVGEMFYITKESAEKGADLLGGY